MAGTSLLTLIDDITALLDDVAIMTRIAAKKTAGLIGDDLALNAEQVTGVAAARELPVVWKVAKGSLLNKAILIPIAIILNLFLPWITVPLLMLGGLFLSYEGFHKVYGKFFGHEYVGKGEELDLLVGKETPQQFEKRRVYGAIRTDFILSAEIIVIALGEVKTKPWVEQGLVLGIVGVGLTLFVYGFVGVIVKVDDFGAYLARKGGGMQVLGRWIVASAPMLMRGLGIIGTIAMFLVGGGIFVHNIEGLHHVVEGMAESTGGLASFFPTIAEFVVGVVLGAVVCGVVGVVQRLRSAPSA